MSTKRGNVNRNRPQKYQNRTAFKNDLHDKTREIKFLNSMHVSEVCEHCKSVIEWKIKYKKYKILSQPKTCTKCQQRNVKKAYHVICRDCAIKCKQCAKCLKSGDEVRIEPPEPTEDEQIKLKVEMERLIKSLPERKRRSFLRYMQKGKATDKEENEEVRDEGEKSNIDSDQSENENIKERIRVPHTRDDLLKRIEELKLASDDLDIYEDDEDYSDSDED